MEVVTKRRAGLAAGVLVVFLIVASLAASLALAEKPTRLVITKNLAAGSSAYKVQDFSVKVTGPGSYNHSESFGSSGKITLDLTTPGTYKVTEVGVPGDITSDADGLGQEVEVVPEQTSSVTITNTYIEPVNTATEIWSGNGSENNCPFGGYYHWILTAGGGGSSGFEILSATLTVGYVGGASTVTTGERRSDTGKGAMHFDVYAAPGEVAAASVLYQYVGTPGNVVLTISHSTCNLPQTGSLQITKRIVNPPDSDWTPDDFSLTVVGPAPANAEIYSGAFPAAGTLVLTDLQPGDYTITESDPGAKWVVTGEGSVTVSAGTTTSHTLTNTWPEEEPLGSVTVTKVLMNAPNGTAVTQFSVRVTGPGGYDVTKSFLGNGTAVFDNLVLGGYAVAEISPSGDYTVTYDPDDQITLTQGDPNATVTVTNTYEPPVVETGSLTIDKALVDAPDGTSKNDFTLTVSGPSFSGTVQVPGSELPKTFDNLIPGTYTVGESAPGPNWTASGTGDVEVAAGQSASATVTNAYVPPVVETGSLTITKFLNDPQEQFTKDQFRVRVTGPGGYNETHRFSADGQILLTGLTPGIYTVTEIGLPPDGTFNVEISDGGVVEVPAGGQASVTVTNTRTVTSSTSTPPTSEGPTDTSEPTPPTSEGPTDTSEPTTSTSEEPTTTSDTEVGEVTTEPPTSTSTTAYPLTSIPTPGQIQTGGGGTSGLGAGVWSLAALAAVLGIGLSASALRARQRAK